MIGYVIAGIVGVLLVAITILLLTGRGASLIAGFNTLSKTQKETYDKPALCKFVGKILIPMEIAVFAGVIGGMLALPWAAWAMILFGVLSFPYILVVAVYANTGNRFRK